MFLEHAGKEKKLLAYATCLKGKKMAIAKYILNIVGIKFGGNLIYMIRKLWKAIKRILKHLKIIRSTTMFNLTLIYDNQQTLNYKVTNYSISSHITGTQQITIGPPALPNPQAVTHTKGELTLHLEPV